MSLSKQNQLQLLSLAKKSIEHGLRTGRPLHINLADFAPELTDYRASFVTLLKRGQLRGCIGMLEAVRPLVQDVVENAFSAAFNDPRFPPVTDAELNQLDIHLSLLTPSEPIDFSSEQDLLAHIQTGVDGLILQDGHRRATFLPSVWEQLPEPEQFLRHLKQKAGLPPDYWSVSLKVDRYQTEVIE